MLTLDHWIVCRAFLPSLSPSLFPHFLISSSFPPHFLLISSFPHSRHSQAYDFERKEIWWVMLCNHHGQDKQIRALEKVTGQGRVEEKKLMFQAPGPGQYEFELHLKCDSYMGLDQAALVSFTVHSRDILPEYEMRHQHQHVNQHVVTFFY